MNKSVCRPRNPKSPNYKLIVGMFGHYISLKDMSPAMLRRYKSNLKMYA